MSPIIVSGLAGAGGGLARSLLGWARSRKKFQVKRVIESIIEGFIAGCLVPNPIQAALVGWCGSDAIGKVIRLRQKNETTK